MLGDCISQHLKNLPTRISQLFGAAHCNFNNLVADNQNTCVQTPRELKLVNQAGHRPGIGARSIKGAQEWVVLQKWANLYLR